MSRLGDIARYVTTSLGSIINRGDRPEDSWLDELDKQLKGKIVVRIPVREWEAKDCKRSLEKLGYVVSNKEGALDPALLVSKPSEERK